MNAALQLVAAITLASPAFAQSLAEPDRAPAIQHIFDTAPASSTLHCEIAPMIAALNYGFQFQSVYSIQLPLSQFSGSEHTLDTYTRVTPEGRPPVYLLAHEQLPKTREPNAEAETTGAFLVGEGTYRAEVLVEDDAGRVCRAAWTVQAHRTGSERQLGPATPAGTVEELTLNFTPPGEPRPGPRVARLTLLVNAAPLAPKATALSPFDIQKTVNAVTSILREIPAQTVRLIAFNLDQRTIIFRDDAYQAGNTGELADALGALDFSVLDYRAIRDRMDPLDLLVNLVQTELQSPQSPDALIVIGPRTLLVTPLPAETASKLPNSTTPIFSLQFQNALAPPRMPPPYLPPDASQSRPPRAPDAPVLRNMTTQPLDAIERLVARIKGQTLPIRNPHDLADAIQRMDARIAKSAPAAPPLPPAAAPPPAPKSAPKSAVPAPTLELTGDEDPLDVLIRLRDRVTAHGDRIPNHTCVESVQRDTYEPVASRAAVTCDALIAKRNHPDFAQTLTLTATDWLRLDVAFSANREIYSWAGAHKFEEGDVDELVPEGAIGTGAFTSLVLSAFERRGPKYIFEGETKLAGRRLFEYGFAVAQPDSHYRVRARKEWVITGYSGNLLVDPKTAELVRLTVRTEELPPATDTCETHTTLEYEFVQLSGADYLLPKIARQRFIGRDGSEAENIMTFSACRDFQAESKIAFDAATAPNPTAGSSPAPLALPDGLPLTVELTTPVRFAAAAAGDRIEGRLAKPVLDQNKHALLPAGTLVQGRLMRVELRRGPRAARIVALRWETAAGTPLTLLPARRTANPQASANGGLRRRGMELELPLPTESRYGVYHLPGTSASLDPGFQSDWVTAKP